MSDSEKINKNNQAECSKPQPDEGYQFWPTHVLNQVILLHIVVGLLFTLSILLPFSLSDKADPLVSPEVIKPIWYLLPMYAIGKLTAPILPSILLPLAALIFLFWPFIDKLLDNRGKLHLHRFIGLVMIAILLAFGVIGYELAIHPMKKEPTLYRSPNPQVTPQEPVKTLEKGGDGS